MATGRRHFVCAAAILAILVVLACPFAKGADPAPQLSYQFKPDQKIAYSVKIEADLPGSKDTLSGNVFYVVKSIDDDTGFITLTTYGNLSPRIQQKPNDNLQGGPVHVSASSPFGNQRFNAQRQIVIDNQGKVVKNDGDAQLPLLLGNLWSVALEPLPSEPKSSWDTKVPVEISSQHGRVWGLPLAMGFSETNLAAQESVHCSIGKSSGNDLTINKKFELATDEQADAGPVFEQKGEGSVVFDQQAGLIKSVEMKITTRFNRENTSVRIPMTLTAHILSADQTEKLVAKRKEAMDAVQTKAMEALKAKPLTGAEINVALLELKDRDMFTVQRACERLAITPPVASYRKLVTKELEPLLNDREHWVRINAIKALAVWGTKDNVAALSAIANDNDYFVKEAAKTALVSIMTPPEERAKIEKGDAKIEKGDKSDK